MRYLLPTGGATDSAETLSQLGSCFCFASGPPTPALNMKERNEFHKVNPMKFHREGGGDPKAIVAVCATALHSPSRPALLT